MRNKVAKRLKKHADNITPSGEDTRKVYNELKKEWLKAPHNKKPTLEVEETTED